MRGLVILLLKICVIFPTLNSKKSTQVLLRTHHNGRTQSHHNKNDGKIVGGKFVTSITDFPYIVSIQKNKEHLCCGGLLSMVFVITACHCTANLPDDDKPPGPAKPFATSLKAFRLVVGTKVLKPSFENTAQVRVPKSFHHHPKCQVDPEGIVQYDLGVVLPSEPFIETPYVTPAKMYTWDDKTIFDQRFQELFHAGKQRGCNVAGWGETRRGVDTDEVNVASFNLKQVRMFIMSDKDCVAVMHALDETYSANYSFIKNLQICTVSQHLNESDCQGDSGSPYVCEGHIISVVSNGLRCGEADPSIWQLISAGFDWFRKDFPASSEQSSSPSGWHKRQRTDPDAPQSSDHSPLSSNQDAIFLIGYQILLSVLSKEMSGNT